MVKRTIKKKDYNGRNLNSRLSRLQKKREAEKQYKKTSLNTYKTKLLYSKTNAERNRYRKLIKRKEDESRAFQKEQKRRFGTTMPFSTKNIARSNKILEKERIEREKKKKEIQENLEKGNIYRYSLSYYVYTYHGSTADKTFKAEVYVKGKQDKRKMEELLTRYMYDKMRQYNRGMQKLFANSNIVGSEEELVGENDMYGVKELNRPFFWME